MVAAALALALLQGSLVALPKPDALGGLRRLRSPLWALLMPGSILFGTFGPLATPRLAVAIVVVAGITALPLAAVAAVAVVRGPRAVLVGLSLAAAVAAALAGGLASQLAATVLTALGSLALGTAVARLIPARWVLIGIVCMSVLDIALLLSGAGVTATALIANAGGHVRGPVFDEAQLGNYTLDYPDLVLAGVLGGYLAGRRAQHRVAVLVAAVAGCCFVLTPPGTRFPATVPVALGLLAFEVVRQRRPRDPADTVAGATPGSGPPQAPIGSEQPA